MGPWMELHQPPLSPMSRPTHPWDLEWLQTLWADDAPQPALAAHVPPLGAAGPGTCLFRNRSLPRRHSSLLSRTPSRVWGSLRQQASGTSSLSRVRSRKTDANLKSSGPLTPQQPNWREDKAKGLGERAGPGGRGTDSLLEAAARQRGGAGRTPRPGDPGKVTQLL